MFWNRHRSIAAEAIRETAACGFSPGNDNFLPEVTRRLGLRILNFLRPSNSVLPPEEAVLHIVALNGIVAIYIAHAPDPQQSLRNFIELLEPTVSQICKEMGR
jgi:hypothetical protein